MPDNVGESGHGNSDSAGEGPGIELCRMQGSQGLRDVKKNKAVALVHK